MDCDFLFLCDYAERDRKLHAVGIGWDTLYAAQLPFKLQMMCLVAQLSGSIAENGTKTVGLRLLDADGADIMPRLEQNNPFEVKQPKVTGKMQLVIQMAGVEFPKYGAYAFHLLLHGNEIGSVPFNVVESPRTA